MLFLGGARGPKDPPAGGGDGGGGLAAGNAPQFILARKRGVPQKKPLRILSGVRRPFVRCGARVWSVRDGCGYPAFHRPPYRQVQHKYLSIPSAPAASAAERGAIPHDKGKLPPQSFRVQLLLLGKTDARKHLFFSPCTPRYSFRCFEKKMGVHPSGGGAAGKKRGRPKVAPTGCASDGVRRWARRVALQRGLSCPCGAIHLLAPHADGGTDGYSSARELSPVA